MAKGRILNGGILETHWGDEVVEQKLKDAVDQVEQSIDLWDLNENEPNVTRWEGVLDDDDLQKLKG